MGNQDNLVVRISGGLGNQLFKLLAGINLSETLNKNLLVDTSWFKYFRDKNGIVDSRHFELDYFPNLNYLNYVTSRKLTFNKRKYQLAKRLPLKILTEIGFVTEENYLICQRRANARVMDGRFEELEFMPSQSRIQQLLSFPEAESDWLQDKFNKFGHNFVALHVRTGDYLKLPHIYGFLTADYYEKAIQKVTARIGDLPIVLFSENIDSAIDLIRGKVNFHYVQGPEKEIPLGETLRLMSLGTGVISAHSTFSWWAAMLGDINQTTKVVTMPSRFLMSDDKSTARLRPTNWLVIDV